MFRNRAFVGSKISDWFGTVPINRNIAGISYIEILVVAGGGGTGYDVGGGGGAGGLCYSNAYPVAVSTNYTITVGNGGSSGQAASAKGTNGQNSIFSGITAIGGGGGGAYPDNGNGLNGGSGGGAGDDNALAGQATQTSGQNYIGYGYNGGTSAAAWGGGGGGGAGGPGQNGSANTIVSGGLPFYSSITGSSVAYAGGGFGNNDGGTLRPTGQNSSGTQIGYYGFGANGTGAPNASTYSGNPGVIIIAYPNIYSEITNIGAGLTYSLSKTSRPGYNVYTFTSGTGTLNF